MARLCVAPFARERLHPGAVLLGVAEIAGGDAQAVCFWVLSAAAGARREELESSSPAGMIVLGSALAAPPSEHEHALTAVVDAAGESVSWIHRGEELEAECSTRVVDEFRRHFALLALWGAPAGTAVGAPLAALVDERHLVVMAVAEEKQRPSTENGWSALVDVAASHSQPVRACLLRSRSAGNVSDRLEVAKDEDRDPGGDTAELLALAYVPVARPGDLARSFRGALAQGPRGRWFRPLDIPHPIFADPVSDVADRQRLHEIWRIPQDRPFFRATNALALEEPNWPPASSSNPANAEEGATTAGRDVARVNWQPHAQDVHERLQLATVHSPSASNDYMKLHLVSGHYRYYHYGQDGIHDSGWGCAYRSLQTIFSWFQLQRFTAREFPPSHQEIQDALVRLGDKPPTFSKSRNWIGSMEVGLVLQDSLSIEFQLLFVQSGSEVPSQAPTLARHFDTVGTPVMIGGGVLAYTLLGIAYDEDANEVRFLILDPHFAFSGRRDHTTETQANYMKTIKKGKWCAWKGPELFKAGTFYNFCLPQRPAVI
jgi:Peptidase family C78